MDIPAAIELNKTALLRIIASLFAMLEAAQARIPVALHRGVARVLRPAESAVRRLIVTLARISNLKALPPRSRPAPTGLAIVAILSVFTLFHMGALHTLSIVGLVVAPDRLLEIRRNRLLSLNESRHSAYTDPDAVREAAELLVGAKRPVIYAGQGQYDRARQALEQSIRTHPSYATAYEKIEEALERDFESSILNAIEEQSNYIRDEDD